MNDPYPSDLAPVGEFTPVNGPTAIVATFEDQVIRVLNRIANALEHGAPQPVQNVPQARPNLQPLPPVTQVDQKPPCPFHGFDKVRPSTNGAGGFFCSAKGGNGPTNAKGYCTWHS